MKAFLEKVKAFFAKVWKWSLANKAIAIGTAAVVVAGAACAIVLPIALHEHSYSTEWTTDATNHWHVATCKHEDEISDLAAHTYDNACDTTCNDCGYERTVGAHVYDNACDADCNVCTETRTPAEHVYDNACDADCNVCGETRTAGAHDYATTWTVGETTHYYECTVCGDKKDETAHTYDQSVATATYLKAEATATTKAQYYKSCVCGKASATEYFETDKAPASLQVSEISKTYDGTPVAEPTVTFDGRGTEAFAYYKGDEKLTERPTDAGTYKVVVTVDETDTHAGDRVEQEFTITKRPVWAENVEFTYDGYDIFCGDEYPIFTLQNVVSGETIDLGDVSWCFDGKNVGATLINVKLLEEYNPNYTIDFSKCSASIVPKVIDNLTYAFEYAGSYMSIRQLHAPDGVIAGDDLFIEISFESGNAGALVLTGEDAPYLDGDDCDNYVLGTYEFSIVPKTLNYLELTKVYDGEGVLDYALGTEHGVVAGDAVLFYCDEAPDYIVGTYKLIPYDDSTIIDDSGADDRALLGGADAANYKFAERIEGKYKLCATITVTPREVWVTGVKFEYYGDNYYDDESLVLSTIHNAVSADENDLRGYFKFTFDNSNVGSNLISVELDDEDFALNYAVNFSKCSAEIVCREIEVPTTASFEYVKDREAYNLAIGNLQEGENLALPIHFRKAEVGSDTYYAGSWFSTSESAKTAEELLNNYKPAGYTSWDEYKTSIFQTAEITPRLIDFPQEGITKVYDQTANFSYTVSEVTNEDLAVSFVAVNSDGVALKDAGEFTGVNANSVVFSINGAETKNYAFRETEGIANVTITPKELNFTKLYFNYPPSYYYSNLEIRLGTAVGVYEGDVVRLFANFKNTPANNSAITLDTASSIHLYAENNATTNKNHVLPEDKSTITVYTSTFDFITIDPATLKGTYTVDSDFTDCILSVNIPSTGGYIFSSSENFMTDSLYDANGNIMKESTNTPGNYGLEAGYYYWKVSVNSTPLGTLNVEKNIPTGAKERPHEITYNSKFFTAEDSHVDWSVADEYYYKASLRAGTYTVSQKGLKISVFDTSWNTVATLTDKFSISDNGTYYVYISKGDNAEVYDTITKFTLVNDYLLDGNADFMYNSSTEQGVLVSESYAVNNGDTISFCFDPEYNISFLFSFELISDTQSFGNLVASYRFYDSDFRAVDITWDGETLTFPNGYTEQDSLYIVVQFKTSDTGVYIRAE